MSEFVQVYLTWQQFTPDVRQWKPSMPVLVPENVKIVVDVPKDPKYVAGNDGQTILLTPEGMRYTINKVEEVMQPRSVVSDNLSNYKDEDFE